MGPTVHTVLQRTVLMVCVLQLELRSLEFGSYHLLLLLFLLLTSDAAADMIHTCPESTNYVW